MRELHLAPARKQTVVDSIIDELIAQIQSGNLEPGAQLPSQRDLSKAFGAGRSSVREALQALAGMNLVRIAPGKGTFVTEAAQSLPNRETGGALSETLELRMRSHMIQARIVIERPIVRLAAEQLVPESADAIRTALEAYEERSWDAEDGTDWRRHDRLHLAIAEATGNPLLPRVLEYLLDLVPRSVRDRQVLQAPKEEVEEHLEIERQLHRDLCMAVLRQEPSHAEELLIQQMEYEAEAVRDYFAHIGAPSSTELT